MAKSKKNKAAQTDQYMTEFAESYGNTNTSYNTKAAKKKLENPQK